MSRRFATVIQFTVSLVLSIALTGRAGNTGRPAANGIRCGLRERVVGRLRRVGNDAGMSTAEYAVGTIAACAFAAVLFQVVTGDSIVSALRGLITSALSALS